jgi:hypothetical protein
MVDYVLTPIGSTNDLRRCFPLQQLHMLRLLTNVNVCHATFVIPCAKFCPKWIKIDAQLFSAALAVCFLFIVASSRLKEGFGNDDFQF